MTNILTGVFIVLWATMAVIDGVQGDTFHMATSAAICLWNASFLNDSIKKGRLEKAAQE